MTRRPIIFGGAALIAGYIWGGVRDVRRPVSPQLVAFVRREQIQRLKTFLQKALPRRLIANNRVL
jgi:hypothetical protein